MIEAIDHIAIVVSDLERSVAFYVELLDFRELRRVHMEGDWIEAIVGLKNVNADVVYLVSPGGEPRLELLCFKSPTGDKLSVTSLANTVGLRYLALRVTGIEKTVASLKKAGVPFFGEPVRVPTSVVRHAAGQKTLCYFRDPDGVIVELSEYR